MKKILSTSVLLLAIAALAPVFADSITVVEDAGIGGCEQTNCYAPGVLVVNTGDTITLRNTDNVAHTFTSGSPDNGPSGIFDTSMLLTGSEHQFTVDTPQQIPYYCAIHPWMVGLIIVEGTEDEEKTEAPPQRSVVSNSSPSAAQVIASIAETDRESALRIAELEHQNDRLLNQLNDVTQDRDQLLAENGALKQEIKDLVLQFTKEVIQLNEWFRDTIKDIRDNNL